MMNRLFAQAPGLAILVSLIRLLTLPITGLAADLPLVRIAHGAFSEKIAVMWLGAEQGIFRKHGVNVEVIAIRSGPQTMAALASGDIQIAYTIPGSVVSAAASGMDVAFFGGIINLAEGDFMGGKTIRSPQDLKGKRLGVQSIGGGTWSNSMLAIEYLGLEPNRDKITVLVVGDTPVLAQSLSAGLIEAAYLTYGYSKPLKEKGFPAALGHGQGADSLPRAGPGNAPLLPASESANHRCAHARLCRIDRLHTQAGQ